MRYKRFPPLRYATYATSVIIFEKLQQEIKKIMVFIQFDERR